MHYTVITILTLIRLVIFASMLDLPILEASPYSVRLWCNYLASALLLWCPLLLTERRRWTYVVSLLLDIWLIGNLIYFRSYGDLLNRWCLLNVGNMDGIWLPAVGLFSIYNSHQFVVFKEEVDVALAKRDASFAPGFLVGVLLEIIVGYH